MIIAPNPHTSSQQTGFTLIELSIVLVIIGLVIGGVLVGQNLIAAAGIRAEISQIDKYNQAVNTFRGKYGYLPGDIPNPYAPQFGFATRGTVAGEGDGNGLLQGPNLDCVSIGPPCGGANIISGELGQFWIDLSAAGLIDGGFNLIGLITGAQCAGGTNLYKCFPRAKIGGDSSYVYVWSGGWQELASSSDPGDNNNYFEVTMVHGQINMTVSDLPSLTVAQAYTIDTKIDDGLPQYGRVLAVYGSGYNGEWAAGGTTTNILQSSALGDYDLANGTGGPVVVKGDIGDGTAAGTNSCYDGGVSPNTYLPEKYSIEINEGAGVNCALAIRFQ